MALEDKLDALTAALTENTAVMKTLIEMRAEAVETVRNAAAPAKSTKASEKAAAEASKPKDDAKASEPAAEADYTGLPELIAGYVGSATREEERAARKDKIKKLLRHEQICKPEKIGDTEAYDAMDIKPDAIALFKEQIKLLTEAGDLTKPASGGALVL
ncbi:hypothetical protein [Paracoccus yeei]|uniref:hypothetical protein n=1 Tax=Paracoccus yeei TaxID=147645 RepID=UPI00174A7489|nr:hypothetical protein [Paracoccus yeei]